MNDKIKPTTMLGIKRLAKQIKKTRGLKYHVALDEAAVAAGFSSFKTALIALKDEQR